MPKVATPTAEAFLQEVNRAFGLRGWTLDQLSAAMAGSSGRSSLSRILNGNRPITQRMAGRLIAALELDESWMDLYVGAPALPEAQDTAEDKLADATLAKAEHSGDMERLREEGITEKAIIRLAQRIARDTDNLGQAWLDLQDAMDMAVRVQQEGVTGSNHGGFVDEVLARVAGLARDGDYAAGLSEIDAALKQADAQKIRLMDRGVELALLEGETAKAAGMLIHKADLEAGGLADIKALRALWRHHYEIGRDKGVRAQSRLAIDLARQIQSRAVTTFDQGAVLVDLGNALWTLGERESAPERLQEAVTTYRAALDGFTRDEAPLDWAMTQNNLGNALKTLGEREGDGEMLAKAITAYENALKERSRGKMPMQWATTQNNLGNALRTLGEREGDGAKLAKAITAYKNALKEWTRDKVPLQWAATQNNLGNALQILGEREGDGAKLAQAITAYENALKEWTRDKVPLDWAMTQNNLGAALRTLGDREGDGEKLAQAVAAYENALKERTREKLPLDWATTQNNLGNALRTLGEREGDREKLAQAITAYENALKEWTRDRVPLQWAMTQGNLASVFRARFDLSGDPADLDRAGAHIAGASEVFRAAGADQYLAKAEGIKAKIEARRAGL